MSSAGLRCALACWIVLCAAPARGQCSGGAACPPCTECRVPPASGTNPTIPEFAALIDRVAALGGLGAGTLCAGSGCCGGPGPASTVSVSFPCILLKAIYATESNWRQFCDGGQTVISASCGFGLAQVTSGMRRDETSTFDPELVASSADYNAAVGATILAEKWRLGPCVGESDPQVIEHWYFATWGYNGFTFKNNPNNPMYSASRPEFRTPGIASAQTRGNYPYQEIVWGYAHYPPSTTHYRGVALAYPDRTELCSSCGRPTTNLSELEGAHRGGCEHLDGGSLGENDADLDGGDQGLDASSVGVDGGAEDTLDARTDAPDAGPLSSGESGCGCGATKVGSSSSLALLAMVFLGLAIRLSPRRVKRPPARRAPHPARLGG